MTTKPFAESCVQNREPIQQVLAQYVDGCSSVLEVGSGTGQHAVYFAEAFPWLRWQTSDLVENHAGIQAWIDDSGLDNILPPLSLDSRGDWPDGPYDLVFSANTLHIMDDDAAEAFMRSVSRCIVPGGVMLNYGPFNYQGAYTSASNARFDDWLKQRDPASGIKNFEWLQGIAAGSGLKLLADHAMPANNRILAWRRITE